jgi:hypothetical protein
VAILTALERLELGPGPSVVSDDGLSRFQSLKRLRLLRIGGARVADRGLRSLGGLSHLTELHIEGCPAITDDGVRRLQETRPDLKIVR